MESICNLKNIKISENKSDFIFNNCKEYNFINLNYLYFTKINEKSYLIIIIILLIIIFCFNLLDKTSNILLTKSFKNISKNLKLSQTIAACTLLSFSNGAPDILTSIYESNSKEGIILTLSSLIGASIFNFSCTIGNCLKLSKKKEIKLFKYSILKEILFLFFAIFLILFCNYKRSLNLYIICIFIFLYILNIIITIKIDKYIDIEVNDQSSLKIKMLNNENELTSNTYKNLMKKYLSDDNVMNYEKQEEIQNEYTLFFKTVFTDNITWNKKDSIILNIYKLFLDFINIFCTILIFIFIPFKENSLMKFLFFIIFLWNSIFNSLIFGLNLYWSMILLMISIMFYFIVKRFNINYYYFYIDIITIISGIGIMKLCCSLIIDIIYFLSIFLDLNKIFLTIIILAIGNSLGDYFSNSAWSKNGLEIMSIMGCFSSQIFNIYFGFSITSLFKILSSNKNIDLFFFNFKDKNNKLISAGFLILIAYLLIFITFLCFNNFTIKTKYYYLFYIFYLIFIIVEIIINFF